MCDRRRGQSGNSFESNEEYGTFILALINGKQILKYSDVLAVLINYKVRRKDKQFSSNSITIESITTKGCIPIIGRARESLESPKLVVMKS